MNLVFDETFVQFDAEFGSDSVGHRERLRERLYRYVLQESERLGLEIRSDFRSRILDLSRPPRLAGWSLSISHCPTVGGFIALPSVRPIGLDLEIASRISPKVIHRIASFPSEKNHISDIELYRDRMRIEEAAASFWTAKEAAIKAFGNLDPESKPYFGDVEITAFDIPRGTFEACRVGRKAKGRMLLKTRYPSVLAAMAQIEN